LITAIIAFIMAVISLIFLTAIQLAWTITTPFSSRVCCETPSRFGADYIPIQFSTTDGLILAGWYIPPRNGAVVILVHSYNSDRRQTLPVAEMLYQQGYGLLMYDQRASGESAGAVRSLGAMDIPDLGQAARWLLDRNSNLRIGAYGCSMGGAISLAGAVNVPSILAVAADAASPLSWSENMPAFSLRDPISLPTIALYYRLVQLRTQAQPPTSTVDAVRNFGSRPVLFISSGNGAEFNRINFYFEAAIGPKSHWNIPEASHCGGPFTRPADYKQHLVDFFNSTLLHKSK
jgi:fermentation-respiration switch protein FrsA (DUF1100 family)